MGNNRWFFWVDRLHISVPERYFVSGLLMVYVLLWALKPYLGSDNTFDEVYYAPLMQAFAEHTADRYETRIATLEQYYPGQTDTIHVLASSLIPPEFAPVVHDELRRRAQQRLAMEDGLYPVYVRSETLVASSTPNPPIFDDPVSIRSDTLVTSPQTININTAGLGELVRLPGIGPSIAERIIAYRTEHGPFRSIEEIMNVRGIGRGRFDQIRHLLTV